MERESKNSREQNSIPLLLLLLGLLIVLMSVISPYFLSLTNLVQMLRLSSVLCLISMGQSLVIIGGGGGIDLSVGSVISLSGIFLGIFLGNGIPIVLAIIITLVFGLALGAINGFLVAFLRIPPLIVSLGTMYSYGGAALFIGKELELKPFPAAFSWIGQGTILYIPVQFILIVLPIFLFLSYMLRRSSWGRNLYLLGGNQEAAHFAGIKVRRYRFSLYLLSAVLASVGAVIMSSWVMTSKADVGRNMELEAITAVMLGGTSIWGGVGRIEGSLIAVAIITVIATGLQLAGINTIWQLTILGIILLLALFINQILNKNHAQKG